MLLLLSACATGQDSICMLEGYDFAAAMARVFAGEANACDVYNLESWANNQSRGPACPYNEYIQSAVSTDGGDTFTSRGDVLVDHAGVPEVTVADDGSLYLYYVDGDLDALIDHARSGSTYLQTHGWVGRGALGASRSTDGGLTFTRVDEFEVDGLLQGMIVDPDVIRDPDGTWRMFYIGVALEPVITTDLWYEGAPHDVYVARSDDLVHWTQDPDPVVNGPYADPTVLCDDAGACVMAAFGIDRATSDDGGETWTFSDDDSPGGFGPEYVTTPDGAERRLYYNSDNPGGDLEYERSTDGGVTWSNVGGDRLPDRYGEAPTFYAASTTEWVMFTHDNQENGPPPLD